MLSEDGRITALPLSGQRCGGFATIKAKDNLILLKVSRYAHQKVFKWANRSPLLSKEGLGVVSHPLFFVSLFFK